MQRVLILFVAISCYPISSLLAQQLDQQYKYAQDQYAVGNKRIALKEYLRTYYFDRESEYMALPKVIADCFVELGDYKHAADFYDHYLNQRSIEQRDRFNANLRKVQTLLLDNNPNAALVQLYNVKVPENKADADRLKFLFGFTFLVSGDIESGIESVSDLSYITQDVYPRLKAYSGELKKNLNTNHNIPRLMSVIIPGTGQLVNGEYTDAANSMLLTGGLLLLMIDVAKNLSVIDGLASVGPFYFRYYLGGINNAHKGSIEKEKKEKSELLSELLLFIKDQKTLSKSD